MRTTVEFEPDVAKAIARLRREQGLGVSDAVNELIRRGLLPTTEPSPFHQVTFDLGLKLDVSNVAEALETLDGADHR